MLGGGARAWPCCVSSMKIVATFLAGLSCVVVASTCDTQRPPPDLLVDCSGGLGSNITALWCQSRGCCFDANATGSSARCTYPAAGVPVHTVHVIHSNHFDAGYAGLSASVVNMYFDQYFPRAAKVGEAFGKPLQWLTHSYLVSLFLDCPGGMQLHCPGHAALEQFVKAVQDGHITWHAFPHNAELALGSVSFGIRMTHDIDARLGQPPKRTLSTRDVPGMTRAAIPVLAKAGVRAVSEGMNERMVPVNVPPCFLWRDVASNKSVIALWHWKGYGSLELQQQEKEQSEQGKPATLNALARAGRLKMPADPDFALRIPSSGHALVYAWRGDNAGPATDVDEVTGWLHAAESYFSAAHATPTAKLSTLDAFVDAIEADGAAGPTSLPIVERELADSWIFGAPSDPLKLAKIRVWQRHAARCEASGEPECDLSPSHARRPTDSAYYNASRLALKGIEHTWGYMTVTEFGPTASQSLSHSWSRLARTSVVCAV